MLFIGSFKFYVYANLHPLRCRYDRLYDLGPQISLDNARSDECSLASWCPLHVLLTLLKHNHMTELQSGTVSRIQYGSNWS